MSGSLLARDRMKSKWTRVLFVACGNFSFQLFWPPRPQTAETERTPCRCHRTPRWWRPGPGASTPQSTRRRWGGACRAGSLWCEPLCKGKETLLSNMELVLTTKKKSHGSNFSFSQFVAQPRTSRCRPWPWRSPAGRWTRRRTRSGNNTGEAKQGDATEVVCSRVCCGAKRSRGFLTRAMRLSL